AAFEQMMEDAGVEGARAGIERFSRARRRTRVPGDPEHRADAGERCRYRARREHGRERGVEMFAERREVAPAVLRPSALIATALVTTALATAARAAADG